MTYVCSQCCQPIEAGVLEIADWRLRPEFTERQGALLKLSRAEANILFVLAQAGGKVIPPEQVGARLSDTGSPVNSVRVLVARIRRKLGDVCPIETIHGRGYRWSLVDHAVASTQAETTIGASC